ncbi:MAG: tRNA (guanosine(46)-N7)-methyltransferase TrmB [Bacilli bacterium]|nr:tRNA (guanosine(46)-N7)-methyltransferase TrmB [Bacilli bacterium]
MRTKYKAWALPFLQEHPELLVDPSTINDLKMPLLLEIGSGKGKFLVDMANKYPEQNFIGVERNTTCSGILAKKLYEGHINNAKLMYIDADKLLDELKDNSVKTIFLNFSDPWPKKRHAKRRLTAENFFLKYHRVLTKDGEIIFKTDNRDLYLFTLETLSNLSSFTITSNDDNYDGLDPYDALTEYEINFRTKGQPIYRIKVKKL